MGHPEREELVGNERDLLEEHPDASAELEGGAKLLLWYDAGYTYAITEGGSSRPHAWKWRGTVPALDAVALWRRSS